MTIHRRINLNEIKMYGRKGELAELKQAYERVELGAAEVVFVQGDAGTGKTHLVEKAFISEDCLFSRGSFGGAGGDSPFSAIVGALADLIEEVWDDEEVGESVAESVQEQMSNIERAALSRFLPSFDDFFGDGEDCDPEWSCQRDSLTRRKVALRHFLRIVTEESDCPVVLCLEDLQYVDAATMDLIEFIGNDYEQEYLLVIGTYRESEIDMDHHLNIWKQQADDSIRRNSINPLSIVTVKGLNVVDVNALLAAVLRLEEGVTFPLATLVMTRTNGNIFFIIQLLEYWQNEAVIFYDLSTFKWTWDIDRVRDTALSDHVVDLVASRIQKHPIDVQSVLQLAACLGYKVDPGILEVVRDALNGKSLDIESNLLFCVQERLMERLNDGRVQFFHEQIHQATMELLPVDAELGKLHFRMGVRLWSHIHKITHSGQKVDDRLLFLCAEQLSMGSQHINDIDMKVKVAQLNSKVGKIAIELSAFATAAGYFELGIALLDDVGEKWNHHHALCMNLYVPFAEAQFYVGQSDSSLEAIELVLDHEPSANAIMRMKMLRLRMLKSQCQLREFVECSLSFLEELGEKLPRNPCFFQARSETQKATKKLHTGLTDVDILKLPRTKSIIMEVLNSMLIPLDTLGMHNLTSIVIARAIKFSINQGITDQSPEAFALFGVYLIAEKQELAEGYRFGELALKLAKKIDPKSVDARVVHWVYLCTKPWQLVPMAQCVDHVFEGYTSAMKRGDPFTAFISIDAYFQLSFCSALELRPLLSDIGEFSSQMLDYGQKMIFFQILPIWQCILNLSGASRDPFNMTSGAAMDRAQMLGNENLVGQHLCDSYLMQIAFYMGDLDLAAEMSAKLQKRKLGLMRASCLYPSQVFFFGLIAISNARKTGKRKYKHEAAKHVLLMRQWVEKKAANLVHKLLIMEAEYQTLETDVGDILRPKYDFAISTARKSGYLQDAAVAAYLAGRLLLGLENYIHFADSYIRKAAIFYKSWGAYAVAAKVRDMFPNIFDTKSSRNISLSSDSGSDDEGPSLGRGNNTVVINSGHLSRERFNRRVSADHERRLSEC